jgi:hypothetical protein
MFTYVERKGRNYESDLRRVFGPKMIVSVSGPSKSGKTTLIRRFPCSGMPRRPATSGAERLEWSRGYQTTGRAGRRSCRAPKAVPRCPARGSRSIRASAAPDLTLQIA